MSPSSYSKSRRTAGLACLFLPPSAPTLPCLFFTLHLPSTPFPLCSVVSDFRTRFCRTVSLPREHVPLPGRSLPLTPQWAVSPSNLCFLFELYKELFDPPREFGCVTNPELFGRWVSAHRCCPERWLIALGTPHPLMTVHPPTRRGDLEYLQHEKACLDPSPSNFEGTSALAFLASFFFRDFSRAAPNNKIRPQPGADKRSSRILLSFSCLIPPLFPLLYIRGQIPSIPNFFF